MMLNTLRSARDACVPDGTRKRRRTSPSPAAAPAALLDTDSKLSHADVDGDSTTDQLTCGAANTPTVTSTLLSPLPSSSVRSMDSVSVRRNAGGAGDMDGVGYGDAPVLRVGRGVLLGVQVTSTDGDALRGTRGFELAEACALGVLTVGDAVVLP